MLDHHKSLEDTFEISDTCIDAVNHAIQKDQADILDSPLSLLGFVCCRLPTLAEKREWFFVCISVGNCKALAWNRTTGSLVDINSHEESTDFGQTLSIYSHIIKDDNTFILILSPGAYLSSDPQYLGKKPKDFNLPHKHWDKRDEEKSKIILHNITEVLMHVSENSSEALVEVLATDVKDNIKQRRENSSRFATRILENEITDINGLEQACILCFDLGHMRASSLK